MHPLYPFSALVSQAWMKHALILNAVDPRIGGVLIRGERGTAKSTAARALAAILPQVAVVADCRFGCDPEHPAAWCTECRERSTRGEALPVRTRPTAFVNLPVSATEDRVVGTLDIEQAIQQGQRRFEPGVLAAANRGLLYIDEVNLLDDHVVDVLLDAAAMGVNIVEREGISFSHPARFILVGTMNPEEGDLRPQLLDRFGLSVEIHRLEDAAERIEIIKRILAFEADPEQFMMTWRSAEQALAHKIERARQTVDQVTYTDRHLEHIARITSSLGVDGHRADLVILKTACAQAAFEGQKEIRAGDIALAAQLALPHRLKRPADGVPRRPESASTRVQRRIEEALENMPASDAPEQEIFELDETQDTLAEVGDATTRRIKVLNPTPADGDAPPGPAIDGGESMPDGGKFGIGEQFAPHQLNVPMDRVSRRNSGRHTRTYTDQPRGRYVRFRPSPGRPIDLAFDATLRAAAPFQRRRAQGHRLAFTVRPEDYMTKVRIGQTANLVLFLVDASYSMALSQRIEATRGAILALLTDAYQRRDRVGLITFNRDQPRLILPPTQSIDLAKRALADIPIGGKTPLSAGLMMAYQVIARERSRNPGVLPILVVVTDGAANVSMGSMPPEAEAYAFADEIARAKIPCVVINVELTGHFEHQAEALATHLKAPCYCIPDLNPDQLVQTVQRERGQEPQPPSRPVIPGKPGL